MKPKSLLLAGAAGLMLTGCATAGHRLVLDAVGPAPGRVASGSANGTLVVYSAYQSSPDFDQRDARRPQYSSYQILNSDGKLRQWVRNDSDTILQRPQRVALAPGNYRVEAEANGYGVLDVPVSIMAGEDTVLHLEGGFNWPDKGAFNPGNSVKLPDGEIVGWKWPGGAAF